MTLRKELENKYGTACIGGLLEPAESDALYQDEEEMAMAAFVDWVDSMLLTGQLHRVKNETIKKWYYNHKPKSRKGMQEWNKYSTRELLAIYYNSLK